MIYSRVLIHNLPVFLIGLGTTAGNLFFFRQIALLSAQPNLLLTFTYFIIFLSLALGTVITFPSDFRNTALWVLPIWQWLGINAVSIMYAALGLLLFQVFTVTFQCLCLLILLLPANLAWGMELGNAIRKNPSQPNLYLIDSAGSFCAGILFYSILHLVPYPLIHCLSLFFISSALVWISIKPQTDQKRSSVPIVFRFGGYGILLIGLISAQVLLNRHLKLTIRQTPYHGLYRLVLPSDTLYYRDNHLIKSGNDLPGTLAWFDLAISLPDQIGRVLLIRPENDHLMHHLTYYPELHFYWQEHDRKLMEYLHPPDISITPERLFLTPQQALSRPISRFDLILIEGEMPVSSAAVQFYHYLTRTRFSLSPDGLAIIKLPIPENYISDAESNFWAGLYQEFKRHYPMVHVIHTDFTLLMVGMNPNYRINPERIIARFRQRSTLRGPEQLFPHFLSDLRNSLFLEQMQSSTITRQNGLHYLIQKSALLGQDRKSWINWIRGSITLGIMAILGGIILLYRRRKSPQALLFLIGVTSLSYFLYNLQLYQAEHGLMIKNMGLLNMAFFGGLMTGYGWRWFLKNRIPAVIAAVAGLHFLVPQNGLEVCVIRLLGWGLFQGAVYGHLTEERRIDTPALFLYDFLGTAMAVIITLGLFFIRLEYGIDLGRTGFPLTFLLLAGITHTTLRLGIRT
ncbi:MAG: hypothetical protein KBA26_08135 [Candidatus Delongbacteria bacterium]|nr:hypothetical protein [Candidatus Delongbacteria bacterium]